MDEAKPFKQRSKIGSRVTREGHARFWERPEVKFLRAARRFQTLSRCRHDFTLPSYLVTPAFPSWVNWRPRRFLSAMRSKPGRWRSYASTHRGD